MADFLSNNYNDNLINNSPNYQNKNFENIHSIADLPHRIITQPKENEFSIFLSNCEYTWIGLSISAVFGAPGLGLIFYLIFSSSSKKEIFITWIVASFLFCAMCLFFTIYALVITFKKMKIILDVDGLKIIKIYLCPCRHDLQIITTGITRFEMSFDTKNASLISINYYDNYGKTETLVTRRFFEDEARYLVYILNKYLQKNSSNFANPQGNSSDFSNPLTPYHNY